MAGGSWTIQIPGMVMLAEFKKRIAQDRLLMALAPAAGIGASILWKPENVWTNLLPGLILGILISPYRSGTTAHSPSDATLRIMFTAMLIWTGMRYLKTKRRQETAKA